MKPIYLSLAALSQFALVACASPVAKTQAAPVVSSQQVKANDVVTTPSSFIAWRNGFRSKALSHGISSTVFDNAFAGVGVNQRVLRLDSKQAEFTKQIWEYLDTATSQKRVDNGRQMLARYGNVLNQIEARYGVDKQVLLAVWGLETSYGQVTGDIPVIESMATLAYQGRRKSFAEEQLLAALKILQNGDVAPSRMLGSWAGAMGLVQFIPTSYLAYAVDFTGDGRRDIWHAEDALASAANYLAKNGWTKGQPWGLEVRVPSGFNYANATQNNRQSVNYWNTMGVRTVNGGAIPNYGDAAVIAPAGARGPKFVVFNNFRVIKRYNNATSYAMAVGHLGDKIMGQGNFVQNWPWDEKSLRHVEKVELQKRLTAKGFDTQGDDGLIGPNTETAIRAYQQSVGLAPDGFATRDLLNQLRR